MDRRVYKKLSTSKKLEYRQANIPVSSLDSMPYRSHL